MNDDEQENRIASPRASLDRIVSYLGMALFPMPFWFFCQECSIAGNSRLKINLECNESMKVEGINLEY